MALAREIPLRDLTYVVFDFETTGLDAKQGDEIVEIGAVRLEGKSVSERTFHSLINPQRSLPAEATRVHGITEAQIKSAPTITSVLPQFMQFVGHAVLVAQNARFDLSFLVKNLGRLCISRLDNPVLDTMLLSKFLFSYESRHNLDAILGRLKISTQNQTRHRSLDDCRLTALALVEMIEQLEQRGLGHLNAIRNCIIKPPPIPMDATSNLSLF